MNEIRRICPCHSAKKEDCLAGKQTSFTSVNAPHSLRPALLRHWRLYLDEGVELAIFMISACFFTVWLFNPAWPILHLLSSSALRRLLMGVSMGATAVLIIRSPLGKRSGAHFNPAITFTYFRLGKIDSGMQVSTSYLNSSGASVGWAFRHFACAAAWPLPPWTTRLRSLDWVDQPRLLAQSILWPLSSC